MKKNSKQIKEIMKYVNKEIAKDQIEHYKDLLLKRDAINKEAYIYDCSYNRMFGDLIVECLEAKIKCIEKKKIIAYLQKNINIGKKISKKNVKKYIEKIMTNYYEELNDIIQRNEDLKNSGFVSEFQLRKIKKIYFNIAKLIHPDMNPEIYKDEKIKDLWLRASAAYDCNQLEELEEIEVLVNDYLKKNNVECKQIEIENLDERIFKLNNEIESIKNSDPYQYKYLLMDEEAVEEKKNDLKTQKDDYVKYLKELDKVIESFD